MPKEVVRPEQLARPAGFSHGIKTRGGGTVYLAGQVAFDASGEVVGRGDLVRQFDQVLSNLKAVVEQAGGAMTDIVKLTLFITDMADYKAKLRPIGEVYRNHFGRHYPAMTAVEIKRLFDDGCLIEIEGVAVID
ncbi:MAG: RidA family protein [Deltaproteobacteria bacterium]|nr:RidA family protein [Deltaproteobacteria bacterium]